MFKQDQLPLDAARTFARYEHVRARLPQAVFPERSDHAASLADLADNFDVFVFDAYGVLNVGEEVVPDAPERLAALKAKGKQVFILTNGATFPVEAALKRYRSLGYGLNLDQVIASRAAAALAMKALPTETRWAAAATPRSALETLAPSIVRLEDDRAAYDSAEAILFLSSGAWTMDQQQLLLESLKANPRPLICANPDLIAPHGSQFSLEPGFFCHHLADETNVVPDFQGKPFPAVFNLVSERIPPDTPKSRICMVGDTLHTDILGGAATGWKTVLVTGHGLFRGQNAEDYIARSGIVPDFVVETT